MNTVLLNKIEATQLKNDLPIVTVGDTVEVTHIIREGDKKRGQKFRGVVIAKKGSGIRQTITVRKISFGVGVEKIFPIHSPNVSEVKVMRGGKVRRSKLYYLREREGKAALRVKQGEIQVAEAAPEQQAEPVVEAAVE